MSASPQAELDFDILECGASEERFVPGTTVNLRMQVQNNATCSTCAILGDAVWLVDGQEVARVEDHEIRPDASVWATTDATITQTGPDLQLTARFENVRFKNL